MHTNQVIIWDDWLAGPVGLVAQYSFLQGHDVKNMFSLRPGSLPSIDVKHIIFIARPKLSLMDLIADYIISIRYFITNYVNFRLYQQYSNRI